VTELSVSAPWIDASGVEGGGAELHNYMHRLTLALANQEVRQRLRLIIKAYDLLAAGCDDEAAGGDVPADGGVFSFGSFRLLPSRRLLLRENSKIRIGSRAFDILTALLERPGEVIGKDELIARVWPNVYVDDSNLKTQVSGVRRALGEGRAGTCYIVAVPGRGYSFVAPVSFSKGQVPGGPAAKQACRYEDIYATAWQRETGNLLSLPELISVLEPCN